MGTPPRRLALSEYSQKTSRIHQLARQGHATYLPDPFGITPWRKHEFAKLKNMGMPPRCLAESENS